MLAVEDIVKKDDMVKCEEVQSQQENDLKW